MSDESMSWEQAVLSLKSRPDMQDVARACYYDDPILDAASRYHASAEWHAVRGLLSSLEGNRSVLDIGSGRGISAFAFARDGWDTYALEPDASDVVGAGAIRQLARESGLQIHLSQDWGESLPYPNSTFDVVHCRAVLHHARDLDLLVKEVARVLKPNGVFIAIREHVVSRHSDIPIFQASHPLHFLYGGEYAYLVDEYASAIARSGLTMRRIFNPLSSDLNTAPSTLADIKRRWALKVGAGWLAKLIPDRLLELRGMYADEPGRLYSFLAVKDGRA